MGVWQAATLNNKQSLIMQTSIGVVLEDELVEPGGALRMQLHDPDVTVPDVSAPTAPVV